MILLPNKSALGLRIPNKVSSVAGMRSASLGKTAHILLRRDLRHVKSFQASKGKLVSLRLYQSYLFLKVVGFCLFAL